MEPKMKKFKLYGVNGLGLGIMFALNYESALEVVYQGFHKKFSKSKLCEFLLTIEETEELSSWQEQLNIALTPDHEPV